jgi:hypothetical protein
VDGCPHCLTAPSPEAIAAIRARLEVVKLAHRANTLNVLDPEHNAQWSDVEDLLAALDAQQAEIATLTARAEQATRNTEAVRTTLYAEMQEHEKAAEAATARAEQAERERDEIAERKLFSRRKLESDLEAERTQRERLEQALKEIAALATDCAVKAAESPFCALGFRQIAGLAASPLPQDATPCHKEAHVSRVCERGTPGCRVKHRAPDATTGDRA